MCVVIVRDNFSHNCETVFIRDSLGRILAKGIVWNIRKNSVNAYGKKSSRRLGLMSLLSPITNSGTDAVAF